jgi:hypothetical protein
LRSNAFSLTNHVPLDDGTHLMGNGYSVLLAVCSAICPASFWSRSANLYWAEHFGE